MTTDHRAKHGSAFVLACCTTVLGGLALAAQARATGVLRGQLGDAFLSAATVFGVGWLVLTCAALLPANRRGLARSLHAARSAAVPRWVFLSGIFGAVFVGAQAVAVPVAGVAMFTIGAVGGQTCGALLVDRLGLGPGGQTPITVARVGAALLAFGGVGLAVSDRLAGSAAAVVVPVLAAVVGGVCTALSAAAGGRLNSVTGRVVATSWLNFTGGLLVLAAICLGAVLTGRLDWPDWSGVPWWAYLAGLFGVAYVANSALVVGRLGVLLLMLLTLTGQMAGAVLFDLLSPQTRAFVTPVLVGGVAVTTLAALLAGLAASRGTRRA